MESTEGVSLETATLEDDGFVLIRGALNPMLADELLSHVNEHLTQTISDFSGGLIAPEEAFGAIAPPAKMVENRWNLLLPLGGQGKLDKLTHEVVASVVSRACCELESAVGPDAALCDLSALVVDPGALAQRLHFDTRFSDAEESSSDDEENIDTNFENYKASKTRPSSLRTSKRLITGFVALQDVREDMGASPLALSRSLAPSHRSPRLPPSQVFSSLVCVHNCVVMCVGPTLICPKTTCASVHDSITRASGEVFVLDNYSSSFFVLNS